MKKPFVLGFVNQKGGVGKTTSAVTIGHGITLKSDKKVLIIDIDPQNQVAESFKVDDKNGLRRLINDDEELIEPLSDVALNVRPNLDIVTSGKKTESVINVFRDAQVRSKIFGRIINNAPYDVIIFDMAPSFGVLQTNALLATDWVIIPTKLNKLDILGLKEIVQTMSQIALDGQHTFLGYSVLPTFFERTTSQTEFQFIELAKKFKQYLWPPILQDTRVREAPIEGKTLWEYSPNSSAMVGFEAGKGKTIGGYIQILDLVFKVLDG